MKQGFGRFRARCYRKSRTGSGPGISSKRKLGNNEEGAARIEQATIHPSLVVGKYPVDE